MNLRIIHSRGAMTATSSGLAPLAARSLSALGKLGPVRQVDGIQLVTVRSFLGDEPMFVAASFKDFDGLGRQWAKLFPQKVVPATCVVGPFCDPEAARSMGFGYV